MRASPLRAGRTPPVGARRPARRAALARQLPPVAKKYTNELKCAARAGNLIRTPNGRICILDFGLMTEVPPERGQALVEYIAHLSVEDFAAVVTHDLPALGFIPPGAAARAPPRVAPAERWAASRGTEGQAMCRLNPAKVALSVLIVDEGY